MVNYAGDIFIKYRIAGAFSPYDHVAVTVNTDGHTLCSVKPHDSLEYKHSLKLNKHELDTLKAKIIESKFFSQPKKDKNFVTDTGETTLTINLNQQKKTLIFRHRPGMKPLTLALWQLANHAIVLNELTQGNAYPARVACYPNTVASHVYSPRDLIIPLEKFIATNNKEQQFQYALKAMSYITTPQEWRDFMLKQLKNSTLKRQALLLQPLGDININYPKEHLLIILPYLTNIISTNAAKKKPLDKDTDNLLDVICKIIYKTQYEKAVPALKTLIFRHSKNVARGHATLALDEIRGRQKRLEQKKIREMIAKDMKPE
jgi:hypothetical protein